MVAGSLLERNILYLFRNKVFDRLLLGQDTEICYEQSGYPMDLAL